MLFQGYDDKRRILQKEQSNVQENAGGGKIMPLPIILGVGAAIAGTIGVGTGIHGASKMQDAKETIEAAESRHKSNTAKFEMISEMTCKKMDELGTLELTILKEFDMFSSTIEKIQNRPQFETYQRADITLPKYNQEELEKVSIGAGVLLGTLSGAALGTAGGFAAAGVTTSTVMALGTASTGTAISSLSGAAATNAALAALGGGALNSGGLVAGGMALGSTILSATTLGVGLMVGGIIFGLKGESMSDKADATYEEMQKAEKTIETICSYLSELQDVASEYIESLKQIKNLYYKWFAWLSFTVNQGNKTDWNLFTKEEKTATENTVLLVGLLYKMCQVNIVEKAKNENEMNTINKAEIEKSINSAKMIEKELL